MTAYVIIVPAVAGPVTRLIVGCDEAMNRTVNALQEHGLACAVHEIITVPERDDLEKLRAEGIMRLLFETSATKN